MQGSSGPDRVNTLRPAQVLLLSRSAFVLALLLATAAAFQPAAAQVVRGRLVDAGNAAGIGGAMVTLIDRSGVEIEQALTRSASGVFDLRAPAPGEYRLRGDRIGYATTYTEYFRLAAGETLTLDMVAPVEAVSLEGIDAVAERRCEVRPEEGAAIATVWEEARKALAATAWTQDRGMYEYDMLRISRQLDRDGRRVESEDRVRAQALVATPYIARSADSLVAGGFARFSAEQSMFWAPDAGVLLADSFLDTHCFRIRGDGAGVIGFVGLDFEPVPGREVPEISGTMWLDAATARLRWLDFQYVNLGVPPWLMDAEPGGRVEFQALPNGTWIVTSWHIRMFTAGETTHPLTGRLTASLDGVAVERGEVLRAYGDEGVVFVGSPGYSVTGSVVDSLGVGAPGARVFVAGSGAEAVTDSVGAFELTHMGEGEYSIHATHPVLEQLWYQLDPTDVEVGPRSPNPVRVDFELPPLREVFDDICGNEEPTSPTLIAGSQLVWRRGIVTGRVTDPEGTPTEGARVYTVTNAVDPTRLPELIGADFDTLRTRTEARTSSSGFYRVCWLPVDLQLQMLVFGEEEAVDRDAIQNALSFTDLHPDRVIVFTIDPESPFRTLDLVTGSR
ncbi:MAG: carboxypeptidase regulatory-like domain-containing protein [Gemmatimonadetes bacterium]|nr:carboxypeptidase regulatory-like domain-containing protein [Gemmatimonadota bacterium]MYG21529.1 carboxypeptidase regulatory-like domain-containing protein [Gemmatimonadota bacterium]MYJ38137.1 carboxypeptidase regulatory-like domain-containing protein [Gemmatimonadota bacterium]